MTSHDEWIKEENTEKIHFAGYEQNLSWRLIKTFKEFQKNKNHDEKNVKIEQNV